MVVDVTAEARVAEPATVVGVRVGDGKMPILVVEASTESAVSVPQRVGAVSFRKSTSDANLHQPSVVCLQRRPPRYSGAGSPGARVLQLESESVESSETSECKRASPRKIPTPRALGLLIRSNLGIVICADRTLANNLAVDIVDLDIVSLVIAAAYTDTTSGFKRFWQRLGFRDVWTVFRFAGELHVGDRVRTPCPILEKLGIICLARTESALRSRLGWDFNGAKGVREPSTDSRRRFGAVDCGGVDHGHYAKVLNTQPVATIRRTSNASPNGGTVVILRRFPLYESLEGAIGTTTPNVRKLLAALPDAEATAVIAI